MANQFVVGSCFGSRGSGVQIPAPRNISNTSDQSQNGSFNNSEPSYARAAGSIRNDSELGPSKRVAAAIARIEARAGRAEPPRPAKVRRKVSSRAPAMPRVTVRCENCGVSFSIKPSRRARFCSRNCAASGEHNPSFKGWLSKDNVRYKLRFERKFPEKAAAHRAVRRALRNGSLVRQPCERCRSTDRIHAHHEDYSKPLTVNWLCGPCHQARHRELGAVL